MIYVKKLHPNAQLPTRSHNSAGYDLYACQDTVLPAGSTVIVPTGITVEFRPGFAALIWDRSGMGAKGIHRFAGVIDADYRGPWGVVLYNSTNKPFEIKAGDRIAQVLFQEVKCLPVKEVSELSDTSRGAGGFGSTGK